MASRTSAELQVGLDQISNLFLSFQLNLTCQALLSMLFYHCSFNDLRVQWQALQVRTRPRVPDAMSWMVSGAPCRHKWFTMNDCHLMKDANILLGAFTCYVLFLFVPTKRNPLALRHLFSTPIGRSKPAALAIEQCCSYAEAYLASNLNLDLDLNLMLHSVWFCLYRTDL